MFGRLTRSGGFRPEKCQIVRMDGTTAHCACGSVIRLGDVQSEHLSLRYRQDALLDAWLNHAQTK